jgi:hypothetical protein
MQILFLLYCLNLLSIFLNFINWFLEYLFSLKIPISFSLFCFKIILLIIIKLIAVLFVKMHLSLNHLPKRKSFNHSNDSSSHDLPQQLKDFFC